MGQVPFRLRAASANDFVAVSIRRFTNLLPTAAMAGAAQEGDLHRDPLGLP